MKYPLVNVHITMENRHFSWENPLSMAIFTGYVSLPEGKSSYLGSPMTTRKPPAPSPHRPSRWRRAKRRCFAEPITFSVINVVVVGSIFYIPLYPLIFPLKTHENHIKSLILEPPFGRPYVFVGSTQSLAFDHDLTMPSFGVH